MRIVDNTYKYLFVISLFIVLSLLVYTANTLSISYKEALNFFINNSMLTLLIKTSTYFFGQNDIGLRIPFIAFYILSVILMYLLTKNFFKKESHRYASILIFMLLPGLISASLLVNSAIVVTFFTLLYIYYYKRFDKHCYLMFLLFLFLDNSFAIFFLAIFFYSLDKKENIPLIVSLIFFTISMYIYGFDTGGKPKGFFVDTFAIYASIFSPLLFIYFFYSVYRTGVKKQRTLIWYISITSLLLSLLFSFRQRVLIEDFAPFVVIFLPYMVRLFLHSLNVRLPQFRKKHYYSATIVLFVLFINVVITIFNKPLYLFTEDVKKHFAYKYNFAKDIALILKEKSINYIEVDDEKLLLRLKFYGIESGDKYFVSIKEKFFYDIKVPINYQNKNLLNIYIIKNK